MFYSNIFSKTTNLFEHILYIILYNKLIINNSVRDTGSGEPFVEYMWVVFLFFFKNCLPFLSEALSPIFD